jgi:hypothetical protein
VDFTEILRELLWIAFGFGVIHEKELEWDWKLLSGPGSPSWSGCSLQLHTGTVLICHLGLDNCVDVHGFHSLAQIINSIMP